MVSIPTGFRALPLSNAQLSLAVVLKCGQSFRWSVFPLPVESPSLQEHEYRLCLRDRVVCLRQSLDTLFYRSVFPNAPTSPALESLREAETLTFITDYFQLDVDVVKLYEQWGDSDPVFRSFESRFSGIRVLRQDPWENLVSFICSSNNNISRITKMVQSLCQQFSPPLLSLPDPAVSPEESENRTYHPFPPPSVLAAPAVSLTLRALGFGYRAEFIHKTAKMLVDAHGSCIDSADQVEPSEQWLKTLRDLSTSQAREELLKFIGVGRKVADCVLLMSLDKREVIPVDTHVYQIAIKHYGLCVPAVNKTKMTSKFYENVNEELFGVWGEYAGWAHTVLFTADLKSFSTYGLSASSAISITPRKRGRRPAPVLKRLSSDQDHPGLTLDHPVTNEKKVEDTHCDAASLADRVKRRKRAAPQLPGGS